MAIRTREEILINIDVMLVLRGCWVVVEVIVCHGKQLVFRTGKCR